MQVDVWGRDLFTLNVTPFWWFIGVSIHLTSHHVMSSALDADYFLFYSCLGVCFLLGRRLFTRFTSLKGNVFLYKRCSFIKWKLSKFENLFLTYHKWLLTTSRSRFQALMMFVALSPVHVKDRALDPSGRALLFPHILRSPIWRWESGLVPLLLLCLPDPSDSECPSSWSRNLFSFKDDSIYSDHTLMLFLNGNVNRLGKKLLPGSWLWDVFHTTLTSLIMSVKIHPTGALMKSLCALIPGSCTLRWQRTWIFEPLSVAGVSHPMFSWPFQCFHVPYSALTMFISSEQAERDSATAYSEFRRSAVDREYPV